MNAREPSGREGLRIGITIGLREEAESMWTNGIKQNAIYLAKLFQHSPRRHQVVLVNTTAVRVTPALPWDTDQFKTESFDEVRDELDVLIELGGQIDASQTAHLKARGTRLVSYCCGPEYMQTMEAIIFGRRLFESAFINPLYDQIWVIPQVARTCLGFFEVLRRRPARVVPFVWDPMYVEQRTAQLPDEGEYRPVGAPKRLAVMEPNLDVAKFCMYPILIAEAAYRAIPGRIGFMHVTNAAELARQSPEFISIMQHLDIVRDGKVSFVDRYDTPTFLSHHADIVISHQWDLPLNYFYFDVCWKGYPLIHNADMCPQLGYFYPGHDISQGARLLQRVLQEHDDTWSSYMARQRRHIGQYLATSPALVGIYDGLLDQLLEQQLVV